MFRRDMRAEASTAPAPPVATERYLEAQQQQAHWRDMMAPTASLQSSFMSAVAPAHVPGSAAMVQLCCLLDQPALHSNVTMIFVLIGAIQAELPDIKQVLGALKRQYKQLKHEYKRRKHHDHETSYHHQSAGSSSAGDAHVTATAAHQRVDGKQSWLYHSLGRYGLMLLCLIVLSTTCCDSRGDAGTC